MLRPELSSLTMSADTMTPPAGGDVDRGSTLIALSWTWASVSLLFVALRFYSRIKYASILWWDDWWILFTLVCTICLQICRSWADQRRPDSDSRLYRSVDHICPCWRLPPCVLSHRSAGVCSDQVELDFSAILRYGYCVRQGVGRLSYSTTTVALCVAYVSRLLLRHHGLCGGCGR